MVSADEDRHIPPEFASWIRKNRRDPQAQRAIDALLAGEQATVRNSTPIEQRVAHIMRHARRTQRIDAEFISRKLAMSTTKMHRSLRKAGTDFRTLKHAERKRRIEDRVASNPAITIKQLSSYMGYSNRNSFCRAFQRLFNDNPSVWLKQRREQIKAKRSADE